MLANIGHKVRELTRVKMGPLTLHGLAPGQVRPLTSRELRELKKLPERAVVKAERAGDAVENKPTRNPKSKPAAAFGRTRVAGVNRGSGRQRGNFKTY
jgi:23S rRNA pseudouridine2605 synthase